MVWLWIGMAFLSGSIPFSYLIGRVFLRTDIREFGDGNPGAYNVFRAGGRASGALAALLDVSKGIVPVGLARWQMQLPDNALIWVALGPVLGHAFSPWLGFRGGKAVAVTFGVWIGLSLWQFSLPMGLAMLVWYLLLDSDAWAVMMGLLSLGFWLWQTDASPPYLWFWSGNSLVLGWKHRRELMAGWSWRPWLHNAWTTLRGAAP
jgi:glycerol-3-phosphate acyltransferase PlsY